MGQLARKTKNSPKPTASPENSDVSDRIWAIRNDIQVLEDLKDNIVNYLSTHPELDAGTRKLWIGDVKEAYYNVVAAWQMLVACLRNENHEEIDHAASARGFLNLASSGVNQSASVLKVLGDADGPRLEGELKKAFKACQEAILRELVPFLEKREITAPATPIIKVSDEEYDLPCAVCSKICIVIRIGVPPYDDKQKLVYEGITMSTGYPLQNANDVFTLLKVGNLKELHQLFKDRFVFEGLDAYCPECDKIYCRDHYNAYEEYNEGFYDDTIGTCPLGHRRVIDD